MADNRRDAVTEMVRNGQWQNEFATPIYSHIRPDSAPLNAQLRELILQMESAGGSATRSNQGGWQSSADFFRLDNPPVLALQQYVCDAIQIATLRVTAQTTFNFRLELYGWAAVNRAGHYNSTHVHPMATWSGIYYVDTGGDAADDNGGLLELGHPIPASVMTFFPDILPSGRLVKPKAGMLILFPSYLQHNVHMYRGNKPRICVPFNAHLGLA